MLIPWCFHGDLMVLPYIHGDPMVLAWKHMLPWCFAVVLQHAFMLPGTSSWRSHGASTVIPWCFHGDPMVLPQCFHLDPIMVFSW